MNLIPLPQSKLIKLAPIFEHRVKESNLTGRTTVGDLLSKLEKGYNQRTMAAFVDNIDDPKAALVMSVFMGIITDDNYANILLIYAAPEKRGDIEYGDSLVKTAEAYARMVQANRLMCSSWVYRGCKDISWFLKKYGFEEQERIFVKGL